MPVQRLPILSKSVRLLVGRWEESLMTGGGFRTFPIGPTTCIAITSH